MFHFFKLSILYFVTLSSLAFANEKSWNHFFENFNNQSQIAIEGHRSQYEARFLGPNRYVHSPEVVGHLSLGYDEAGVPDAVYELQIEKTHLKHAVIYARLGFTGNSGQQFPKSFRFIVNSEGKLSHFTYANEQLDQKQNQVTIYNEYDEYEPHKRTVMPRDEEVEIVPYLSKQKKYTENKEASAKKVMATEFFAPVANRTTAVSSIDNSLVDIVAQVSEKTLKDFGLEKGSMLLRSAEQQEQILKKISSLKLTRAPGGSAANTLRGIAALGGKTTFSSVVGLDKWGEYFNQALQNAGIKTTSPFKKGQTGTSISLVTPDGQRTFATYLGANQRLKSKDVIPHVRGADSKILHTTAYMFSFPMPARAVKQALSEARGRSTLISLDIADPNIVKNHRAEIFDEIKKGVTILFANGGEAWQLIGQKGPNAALALLKDVPIVVIKDGANGAYIGVRGLDKAIHIPTVPRNSPVVDTTGAGDMFAAGFLYALTEGYDVETAGHVGSMLAGDVISRMGVTLNPDVISQVHTYLRTRR